MKIITISREFGSGGRELGKRLADALGFQYYDREILTILAEETALDENYIENILENRTTSSLFSITTGRTFSMLPVMGTDQNAELLSKQTGLIKSLAARSDCVIVGRNADVILADERPLRIFVHADMEARIARCRRRETEDRNLTDKAFEKKIRQIDKQRAKTHALLSSGEWGASSDYELCLNTTQIDIKDLVDVVELFAEKWFEGE